MHFQICLIKSYKLFRSVLQSFLLLKKHHWAFLWQVLTVLHMTMYIYMKQLSTKSTIAILENNILNQASDNKALRWHKHVN